MAAEETLIIKPKVKIKVFGVGGGGNSVLMRMGHHKELDIDLVAINTDAKQLARVAEEGVGRSRSASSRCRSASRAAARSAWPMRASRRCRPRWTR